MVLLFCLVTSISQPMETNVVLKTVSELNGYLNHKVKSDCTFDVKATISEVGSSNLIAEDGEDHALVYFPYSDGKRFKSGDQVHLKGIARQSVDFEPRLDITSATTIGRSPIRPPIDIRFSDGDPANYEFAKVATTGRVIDIIPDEIDARYAILQLKDKATRFSASTDIDILQHAKEYIDARVSVTGTFFKSIRGLRKYSGPTIVNAIIRVTDPPSQDPFTAAPALETAWYMTPQEVAALDLRSVVGKVIAVWDGRRVILRASHRRTINIALSRRTRPPQIGETVKIIGYPQTDLFFLGLSNARWQVSSEIVDIDDDPPKAISAREVLYDANGKSRISSALHGKLIRLRGIVRCVPSDESPEKRLYLDSEEFKVPVDISSCPKASDGIELGSTVEVTGRCVIETTDWTPTDIFPQATGFAVIARSADDFKVLSRPPWWTPTRFAAVVLALLGVIGGIVFWNLVLQALVKHRARQLFRADLARATSELRVQDRTLLAVELHDSLSQNLTGVGMKIEAARQCGRDDLDGLIRHLDLADKTLRSCRNELRNSLWDLRNDALEDNDLNRAIERTLLPHIENVDLAVRCTAPRERFTDQTTHALLKIIRELAVNAIRHGHATAIKVAGAIKGDTLCFSMRDNGTGFDPDDCPGVSDGHFGIQGIRERLDRFNGQLAYERLPEGGMRATISFKVPSRKDLS